MTNHCFPANGNRARLTWLPDDPGVITQAGPEQSVLKHDSGKGERCYPNRLLEPAPTKVVKEKVTQGE